MKRVKTTGRRLLVLCAIVCFPAMIYSCSQPANESAEKEKPLPYTEAQSNLKLRAITQTDNQSLQQVFGGGFAPANSGSISTTTGFLGSSGGFGFGGSIASVIANVGNFGFGGFGTFASFFAGALPVSPPAGILPPPASALPSGFVGRFSGFNFGTPGGSTGNGGPANITPPGVFSPPAAFSSGFSAGFSNNNTANNNTQLFPKNSLTLVDSNLANTNNVFAENDVNMLFVSVNNVSNNRLLIAPLAITETVIDCIGGGTMTRVIDDVDPPGLSSGDSRTTIYNNCINNAAGTWVMNGSQGFSKDIIQGVPFVDPIWATTTTMFQNNLSRENPQTGDSRTSNGSTTTSISVNSTTGLLSQSASGNGTVIRITGGANLNCNHQFSLNFDWDTTANSYIWDINVQVESTDTEQSYSNLTTDNPLTGVIGQAPVSGQLTLVRGVNNLASNIIILTAQPDGTVLVETDSNADGIIDTSMIETNWSNVLFSIFNSTV